MASDRTERRAGTGGATPGFVALFIDWDNFAIGLRQEMPDRPADVGPILRWSRRFGVLSVVRAYGEWRDPSERLAIYNAGVEVVYAPVLPLGGSVQARAGAGGAKSLADTAMAVDVTDALNLMPSITTVILATSDKDLIPVLRFAQRRGLHAVVVGSDRTAGALRELADEFISYRQLLDSEVPSGAQSRPAMVPPVRFPRAPRPEGMRALPAPERERGPRGRFESRSVVVPLDRPLPPPAIGSVLSGPVSGGLAEPNTAVSSVGTPGSVFADGEDQPGGDAAARRRRRGGRRRRGREVTGDPTSIDSADADADREDDADVFDASPPATGAADETVMIGAGDLAARGADAIDSAATEAHDEESTAPPVSAPRPGPVIQRRPEAPSGRGPVVLPGERLRRLASPPAPEPEAEPEPAGEPVSGGPADDAEPEVAAPAARGRARRGGRTRAAKTAADDDADPTGDPEPPADESSEASSEQDAGGAEEPDDGAAKSTGARAPSRGRRRGGRAR